MTNHDRTGGAKMAKFFDNLLNGYEKLTEKSLFQDYFDQEGFSEGRDDNRFLDAYEQIIADYNATKNTKEYQQGLNGWTREAKEAMDKQVKDIVGQLQEYGLVKAKMNEQETIVDDAERRRQLGADTADFLTNSNKNYGGKLGGLYTSGVMDLGKAAYDNTFGSARKIGALGLQVADLGVNKLTGYDGLGKGAQWLAQKEVENQENVNSLMAPSEFSTENLVSTGNARFALNSVSQLAALIYSPVNRSVGYVAGKAVSGLGRTTGLTTATEKFFGVGAGAGAEGIAKAGANLTDLSKIGNIANLGFKQVAKDYAKGAAGYLGGKLASAVPTYVSMSLPELYSGHLEYDENGNVKLPDAEQLLHIGVIAIPHAVIENFGINPQSFGKEAEKLAFREYFKEYLKSLFEEPTEELAQQWLELIEREWGETDPVTKKQQSLADAVYKASQAFVGESDNPKYKDQLKNNLQSALGGFFGAVAMFPAQHGMPITQKYLNMQENYRNQMDKIIARQDDLANQMEKLGMVDFSPLRTAKTNLENISKQLLEVEEKIKENKPDEGKTMQDLVYEKATLERERAIITATLQDSAEKAFNDYANGSEVFNRMQEDYYKQTGQDKVDAALEAYNNAQDKEIADKAWSDYQSAQEALKSDTRIGDSNFDISPYQSQINEAIKTFKADSQIRDEDPGLKNLKEGLKAKAAKLKEEEEKKGKPKTRETSDLERLKQQFYDENTPLPDEFVSWYNENYSEEGKVDMPNLNDWLRWNDLKDEEKANTQKQNQSQEQPIPNEALKTPLNGEAAEALKNGNEAPQTNQKVKTSKSPITDSDGKPKKFTTREEARKAAARQLAQERKEGKVGKDTVISNAYDFVENKGIWTVIPKGKNENNAAKPQTKKRTKTIYNKEAVDRKEAESIVADANKNLKKSLGVEIELVEDQSEIPDASESKQSIRKNLLTGLDERVVDSVVEGTYKKNGKIYVVRNNFENSERLKEVIKHELLHAAFNKLVNDKQQKYLLGQVKNLLRSDREFAKIAEEMKLYEKESENIYLEEVLAKLSEHMDNKDRTFRGRTKQIWGKIVSYVYKFLRKLGLAKNLSKHEIPQLLRGLRNDLTNEGKLFSDSETDTTSAAEMLNESGMQKAIEKFQNNNEFVKTESGKEEFGFINEEDAKELSKQTNKIIESAPIKVTARLEPHLKGDRFKRLKELGYKSYIDLVEDIAKNYRFIYQGKGESLILAKDAPNNSLAYIELKKSENNNFYEVNSIIPTVRNTYFKNRKKLLDKAPTNHTNSVDTPSAVSGGSFSINSISENNRNSNPDSNSRNSLAGVKAETADIASLEEAKKLLAKGVDKSEVWQKTGWYIAKDGKPRFEIPDKNFALNDNFFEMASELTPQNDTYCKLDDIVDHEELFKAYPHLRNIQVRIYSNPESDLKAGSHPEGIEINIKDKNNIDSEAIRKSLIHELQHAIQKYEGFAVGSSPAQERMKLKAAKGRKHRFSAEELEGIKDEAQDRYRRHYGEGEARAVADRLRYYDKDKESGEFLRKYGNMPEQDFDYDVNNSIIAYDEKMINPIGEETRYSLSRVPHTIEEYKNMEARPLPSDVHFKNIKELYDIYKENYLGQTITTASGHTMTLNPGHFFRFISHTEEDENGNAIRKGFIRKAKSSKEAIKMIENGEIKPDDIAGFDEFRAKALMRYKEVLEDPDFYYPEKKTLKNGTTRNCITFGRKYSGFSGDGFLAATLIIEGNKIGPLSFHPKNFSKNILSKEGLVWKTLENPTTNAHLNGETVGKQSVEPNSILQQISQNRNSNSDSRNSLAKVTIDKKFKNWFGDWEKDPLNASKVVDEDGKPLIVYHGTDADFESFDPSKSRTGMDIQGMFFSPWEIDAKGYGKNLGKFYLNLRNPANEDIAYKALRKFQGQDYAGKKAREYLIKQGYDGVIMGVEEQPEEYIAFYPNQIKSATDNNGNFDSNDDRYRYSLADTKMNTDEQGEKKLSNLELYQKQQKEFAEKLAKKREKDAAMNSDGIVARLKHNIDYMTDRAEYNWVNRRHYLKKWQEDIEATLANSDEYKDITDSQGNKIFENGRLSDKHDIHMMFDTLDGRVQQRRDQFVKDYWDPFYNLATKNGVKYEDLNRYLFARHADERDKYISSINPLFKNKRGSGWNDEWGKPDDVMADYEKKYGREVMLEIGDLYDKMNQELVKCQIKYRLMGKDTFFKLKARYKHYTPLKRLDDELAHGADVPTHDTNISQNVTAKAMGRESTPEHTITFAKANIDTVFRRGERNLIKLAMLRLALALDDPSFQVNRKLVRRTINEKTGSVAYQKDMTSDKEQTIGIRNGDQYFTLHIDNAEIYNAFVSPDVGNGLFEALVKSFRGLTANMGANATARNIEFGLVNMDKDQQQAFSENLVYRSKNKGFWNFAVSALKNTIPAAKTFLKYNFEKEHKDKDTKLFDDFLKNGGSTGYMDIYRLVDDAQDLETQMDEATLSFGEKLKKWKDKGTLGANARVFAKQSMAKLLKPFEFINDMFEQATRFANYKTAIEAGMTPQRAAELSKNLTLNFNRHGAKWSAQWNWVYMFSNASLQGTSKTFKLYRKALDSEHSPGRTAARSILLTSLTAGFMSELLNHMFSPDDDDDRKFYDKMEASLKDNHVIIMNPATQDGKYIRLPLFIGFAFPYMIGRNTAAMMLGTQSIGESTLNIMNNITDYFSPVGNDNNKNPVTRMFKMITPTALKPWLDIATNSTFAGNKIRNEAYGSRKPAYMRAMKKTPTAYVEMCRILSDITGGNQFEAGKVDIAPEDIQHIVESYAGGTGKFVGRGIDTIQKLLSNEELDTNNIPFVRRFAGEVGEGAVYEEFNSIKDKVRMIKNAKDAKDYEVLDKYPKRNQLLNISRHYLGGNGITGKFTLLERKLKAGRMTDEEYRDENVQLMKEFNKQARKYLEEK